MFCDCDSSWTSLLLFFKFMIQCLCRRTFLSLCKCTMLALTVEFRKSQDFLILMFGSPDNQIVSFTSKHLTSISLIYGVKLPCLSKTTYKFFLISFYKWSDIFKTWESQTSWHGFLEVPGQFLGVSDSQIPLMQALSVCTLCMLIV